MKHFSIFVVVALLAVGCNQATNTQSTDNILVQQKQIQVLLLRPRPTL